ncbi:MAG: Na+/H+ antiporter subunit D [Verrucomicrobiota bacterium]
MNSIILPILIPLVVAVGCLFARSSLKIQKLISLIGASITFVLSCWILQHVYQHGITVLEIGSWKGPFGIVLVADLFSAIMLVISNLISLAVLVYSLTDVPKEIQQRFYFPLYQFLMVGVNGSFLTGDLFNLYVWFEVMLLSSFVLLALGQKPSQLEGSIKYVSLNLFASILFLSGLGILYGKLGTLNMADIAYKLSNESDSMFINSSAILFLAAFGIKAAVFPFFFWLPASYHTPAVAISAVFAGLLTKVGVYALIRSFTLFFVQDISFTHNLLLLIAAATMITGVLGAATQFEMRKILSFHIVSQIGYMILGLALLTPLALAGAIFYLVHHIVVKTNLFLISGIVIHKKGTDQLKKIGGLYQSAPFLSLLFFIPAFSLGGIPPLSGFWAKFSVLKAGLEIEAYAMVAVALIVGILTLYSMTKIWAEAFWKSDPVTTSAEEHPDSKPQKYLLFSYSPVIALALITLVIGFYTEPFFSLAQMTAEQLLDSNEYINSVLGKELP